MKKLFILTLLIFICSNAFAVEVCTIKMWYANDYLERARYYGFNGPFYTVTQETSKNETSSCQAAKYFGSNYLSSDGSENPIQGVGYCMWCSSNSCPGINTVRVYQDGSWWHGAEDSFAGYWDVICGQDSENDGVPDSIDNCSTVPNGPLLGTCPAGSLKGNLCYDKNYGCGYYKCNLNQEDGDHDGVGDVCDNCPDVYNPSQRDSDNNGNGDACDFEGFQVALDARLASIEQALQNCGCMEPTNVNLSSLKAFASNKKVTLKWNTETEPDNAGFNIWRAEGFRKINDALIPAVGSPIDGSAYDFVDQWVLNGKRYFYLLEDIDTNGISTFQGPAKATPRWIYGIGK
jgi:hypothetical protein